LFRLPFLSPLVHPGEFIARTRVKAIKGRINPFNIWAVKMTGMNVRFSRLKNSPPIKTISQVILKYFP